MPPDAEGAVTGHRGSHQLRRHARKVWLSSIGQRVRRVRMKPSLRAIECADEPSEFVAFCREDSATGVESSVGSGPAVCRGVPDMPLSRGDKLFDKGLEHLHDVEFAAPQGGG